MYNKIRNGIYKKLREFNFEIDPEINTGFQSQNSHQPVKWISWGKEKKYILQEILPLRQSDFRIGQPGCAQFLAC